MRKTILSLFVGLLVFNLLLSCKQTQTENIAPHSKEVKFNNKGHELVFKLASRLGDLETLKSKKGVVYNYTYITPKKEVDSVTEKYLFNQELSLGIYHKSGRSFPEFKGPVYTGFDGENYWLKNGNESITDSKTIEKVVFKRRTNFYWFVLFQKLASDYLLHEYLGKQIHNGKTYDIVKVTYPNTIGMPVDTYQLFINQETGLVDQFLFTVVDYGVVDTPFLMQLEYEEVEGVIIPTKRRYKMSNWDAIVDDKDWISVNWFNINFEPNMKKSDFSELTY